MMLRLIKQYFQRRRSRSTAETLPILLSPVGQAEATPQATEVPVFDPARWAKAKSALDLGDRASQVENWPQACIHYQQAIELAPHWSVPQEKLAYGLEQQGQFAAAIAHYRQALALSQMTATNGHRPKVGANGFSQSSLELGQGGQSVGVEGALSESSDLTQLLDGEALTRAFQRAEALYAAQQWPAAIAQCQAILNRWPRHAPTYKLLGNTLYQQDEIAAAQTAYEQALEHQPDFAAVHVNLGSVAARQERWEDAIAHYQEAIALKPDFAGAYRNLARVWEQQGNERLAVLCQFQAVELEPDSLDAMGYFTLGNRLLAQGQTKGAIACSQVVIERLAQGRGAVTDRFWAGFPPAYDGLLHQQLAEALTIEERWQEAVSHYRQASQLQGSLAVLPRSQTTMEGKTDGINRLALAAGVAIAPSWYRQVQQLAQQEQWDQVAQLVGEGLQQIEPDLAHLYELMAKSLRLTQQPDASIGYYQKMAVLQPHDAKPFANLGSLYAQRQQWQEAIRSYQQAIHRDSEFAGAYRNLARVWQTVGDAKAATECWLKAYELEPDWGTATNRLEMGQRLGQQGRVEEAIATYKKALELDPGLIPGYLQLAALYQQQGLDQQAIAAYGKVLELRPSHCDAAYQLGCLLAQHQQLDRAIGCFKKLVQLEPDTLRGYVRLRDLLTAQGQVAEAIPYYQRLAALQPDEATAQYEWGDALIQAGQWSEAIAPLRRAIELDGSSVWFHNSLGDALMHEKRWDEAAAALRQAIACDPDYSWAHHNLGQTLIELQDWQGAVAELERAIALNPDFGWSHYSLGIALAQLDQWERALDAYRQGRHLDPTMAPVTDKIIEVIRHLIRHSPRQVALYQTLAEEWITNGNMEEAIAAYQMALYIEPNNRSIALALAQLLLPTDSYRAKALLDRALNPGYSGTLNITAPTQLQDTNRVKALLATSHLFDRQYYQTTYHLDGDVNLLEHYLSVGSQQNYSPNPLFDPLYYKQQNPDVVQLDINPLAHYYTLGHKNGCDPHPLFSHKVYLRENEEVAIAQICPLEHYLSVGAKEGRVAFSVEQCADWLEKPIPENAAYLACSPLQPSSCHREAVAGQAIGVYCSSLGNYFITEIADFIRAALEQSGHQVKLLTELHEPPADLDRHIVVAPHEFFYLGEGWRWADRTEWLSQTVMVNVEQPQTTWFSKAFHFMRRSPYIFDINVKSAAMLRQMGLSAYWLPLGYLDDYAPFSATHALPDLLALRSLNPTVRQICPALDAPLKERSLDLHFVGTLTRRRELFFARNARWLSQYRCFWHIPPTGDPFLKGEGQALDTAAVVGLSRRCKILLNLHRDELPYFEWHRIVFFGLWQNTLVLTESCHDVPGLVAGEHYIACALEEMEAKVAWLLRTPEGQAEAERVRQSGAMALRQTAPGIEIMRRMTAVIGGEP